MAWCFPSRYFFECCSKWFLEYVDLRSKLESLPFFSHVINQPAFLLCSFCSHTLPQKCFVSFTSVCWIVLVHSLSNRWSNFFFYFGIFYFASIAWTFLGIFWVFSFANIFWFVSLRCIVRLVCCFLWVF